MTHRTTSILALSLAFVLGCFAASQAPALSVASVNAAPGVPGWEYECVRNAHINMPPFVAKMNELGADGWELVLLDGPFWCFKRPRA